MNAIRVRWLNWLVILALCWPFGTVAVQAAIPQPAQPNAPQGAVTLTLAGQSGGNAKTLAIEANYAYLGVGARLFVLDITNPNQPVYLGQSTLLPGVVQDIVISGYYAYLATSSGFSIVEVTDPANPILISSTPAPAQGIAFDPGSQGFMMVYAVGAQNLTLWNVDIPLAVTQVMSYTFASPSGWEDILLSGSRAYVTGGGTLLTLDVSSPTSVSMLDNDAIPGAFTTTALAISGSFLYVAACEMGVQVFDLTGPTPVLAGVADTQSSCAQGVSISGATAYVSAGTSGIFTFNISLPPTASFRSITDTPGDAWFFVAQGSQAYLADGSGMRVFDIQSPNYPAPMGNFALDRRADHLLAADQTVYALDSQPFGGLRTYNVTTPNQPSIQDMLPHEWDTATNLSILDDRAYYGLTGLHQLVVASIANPHNLINLGSLSLPFVPTGVAAYNNPATGHRYAAVTAGADGLHIVDVSQLQAMQLIGTAPSGDAQGVFVSNNYAYVADGLNGLQIFDLSDPASPQWVGGRDRPGNARALVVAGSLAYMSSEDGLNILDVSNPTSPAPLGFYDTPGRAVGVRVLGRFAFIADDFEGVQVVDVSNPAAPVWDSSYPIPGNVTDLVIADGFVYVAAGEAGLFVYQVNYSSAFVLNGTTTEGGLPLPGVALISPGTGYIQHSNAAGFYEFFHMPEGNHFIVASKPGYTFTPAMRTPVLPPAAIGQDFAAANLSYDVSGRVTDSRGQPLPGVTVADGLGNSAVTDGNGDYTLSLAAGPHHFQATLGNSTFWPPQRFADVPPGLDWQDFTVPAPVSMAANLYGGGGQIVARQGDMLYLQTGAGLSALNVTRPFTPTLTGKTAPLPGTLNDLVMNGRYAYAALDMGGLGVIDLIHPLRPVLKNLLPFPSRVLGVARDGTYLYLSFENGLGVFDLTNPAWPQMLGWRTLAGGGPLVVNAGVAYVGASCNGLAVVTVANPTAPGLAQLIPMSGCVQDVAFSNSYIFAAVGNGTLNGLHILDAASPLAPVDIYGESLSATLVRLSLDGDFAYLGSDSDGLRIYNISFPSNPILVGVFPVSYAFVSAVNGSTVYLATSYDGLKVIDASDPINPIAVNTYLDDSPEYAKDIAIQGAYAYLVDYSGGIRIYDVTSPRNPLQLNAYGGVSDGTSIAVQGEYAYVGSMEGGVYVFNIADPLAPFFVNAFGSGSINDIAVQGGLAYLTGYGAGLRVFDISEPYTITQLSEYTTISNTERILLADGLAYLTQPDLGLHVVDVSDPANPALVDSVDPPELLYGLDMRDGRLYVARETGLVVLDAADLNGAPLGVFNTPAPAYDVKAIGHYVCLATRDGLWVLDVINLPRIVEANFFPNATEQPLSLAFSGNALYQANHLSGLTVFALDGPRPQNVVPDAGTNNATHPIIIQGLNFQPGAQAFLGGTQLGAVEVISNTRLTAVVPAGIPIGSYALRVVNPDGSIGFLPLAYTAYANVPPTVVQVTPSQGGNAFPVVVDVYGSNFAPGALVGLTGPQNTLLNATLYLNSHHLRVAVPPGLATGAYTLTVRNPGNLTGSLADAYTVRLPGEMNDLYALSVDLFLVPADARQNVDTGLALKVRRQGGAAMLTDVMVNFYDGDPQTGGILLGSSTIPRLAQGGIAVTLPITWTFTSVGPHELYAVIDPSGQITENDETNNTIQRSITVYPALADTTPPQALSLSLSDNAALTTDPLIYLNTIAEDDPGGSGLAYLCIVEYEYIPSHSGWLPTAFSGWQPYAESNMDYAWQLTPSPGMHYIQVWVADQAGNVSRHPAQQWINYLPATAAITSYEIHTFRIYLNAGDSLQAALTSLTGDADLYAFAPDGSLIQKSETGGLDEVGFTAPTAGVYQIEVEGVTESTYQLAFTLNGVPSPSLLLRPDPRGRVTPASLPAEIPDDNVGLPSPQAGYMISLPMIMR